MSDTLVAYFSGTNDTNLTLNYTGDISGGTTFTPNASGKLTSIKLLLRKNQSPTTNMTITIYAMTGTYGTNGKPTGSVLATSDAISSSSLSTTLTSTEFAFSGANQIDLTSGTHYCLSLNFYDSGGSTREVWIGGDYDGGGNETYFMSKDLSTWSSGNMVDIIFSVYALTQQNFTRSLSDSIMNGVSRTASLNRLVSYKRSASDSLMNASSRFATVTKGYIRNLSDSIMNGASRLVSVSRVTNYVRSISINIMVGASRTVSVDRLGIFSRSLSDSISNGASRLATVARVGTFARGISDSIMNGASRFTSVNRIATSIRAISENIMNGASRTVTVDKITHHIRTLSDSIMVGAGRTISTIFEVIHSSTIKPLAKILNIKSRTQILNIKPSAKILNNKPRTKI